MTGFSVLFGGSAWYFLQELDLGAKGLVYANGVNMILRIGFNLWFVRGWFKAEREVSPSPLRLSLFPKETLSCCFGPLS